MLNFLIGPEGWGSSQLLGNRFGSYEIVAVTALANDRDASFAFLTASVANVDALIWPAGRLDTTGWDGASELEVFAGLAGRVLERGLQELPHLPGATEAQRQAAAQVWDGIVERVGDRGRMPDELKRQLAGLAAMRMVVDGFGDQIANADRNERDRAVAFFQELSHDAAARHTLVGGAVDYLQYKYGVEVQDQLLRTTHRSVGEVVARFPSQSEEIARVLSALGEGMHRAGVSEQERHAALFAALSTIGDLGVGVGVAASPLTGGASVVVGGGLKGAVGFGLDSLQDATAPDVAERLIDFQRDVSTPLRQMTGWALFGDERLRTELLAAWQETDGLTDRQVSRAAADFGAFLELEQVRDITAAVAGSTEQGVLVQVLWADLLGRER
jgi:hypothetical protein